MWQPTKKKPCTIMVSIYSGFDYVFVKTVMEKFIKPFMDALISEPDEDPLGPFSLKVPHKIQQTETVKVQIETKEKCNACGLMCKGNVLTARKGNLVQTIRKLLSLMLKFTCVTFVVKA